MTMPLAKASTIVLTGATSGIGAQLKDRLLADGHKVIAISRRATRLTPHTNLHPVDCDLSSVDAVQATISHLCGEHERIDMLINNAALQYAQPLTAADFDSAQMCAEVAINLVAPALLAQGLLPALRRAGPGAAIVNMSSGLAFAPKRATALYCATKAGLHSFSQSLRCQLEDSDIRVIEVVLPLVDTPMTEGRGSGKISAADAADAALAGIRAGRPTIYVGKARLLPILARIAPSVLQKIMRGA